MNRRFTIAGFTKLITVALIIFLAVAWLPEYSKETTCSITNQFKPGQLWLADDSLHINAHGGGILFHEDKYYWFGEHKTSGKGGNTALVGVGCYSSSDLYNWKNEGIALPVVDQVGADIEKGCVIERPKVIYNETTRKFVMWFHLELKGQGYNAARTAVAVSDKVAGPYTYLHSLRPNKGEWPLEFTSKMKTREFTRKLEWWTPEWKQAITDGLFVQRDFEGGQMARDMSLFVDEDGAAFHIFSSEDNLTIHISELSPDYLGFTGRWTRFSPAGHNEAPAIFKYRKKYFLITSGCTGWDPNAARLAVAESIWGPWTELGNPCQGEGADLTFHSQSTHVLPVQGKTDAFIFMGDRWNPKDPVDGRYVWLPISFESEKPVINWHEEWNLSVFNLPAK